MMRSLAQALTEEYSDHGVHVANVIIDGVIDAPGVRALAKSTAANTQMAQPADLSGRLIDPTKISRGAILLSAHSAILHAGAMNNTPGGELGGGGVAGLVLVWGGLFWGRVGFSPCGAARLSLSLVAALAAAWGIYGSVGGCMHAFTAGTYRALPSRASSSRMDSTAGVASLEADRPACCGGSVQRNLRGRLSRILVRVPPRAQPA